MKKLLIMTGVAAFAFGAFATLPNGSGFESRTADAAFDSSDADDPYWSAPNDLEATVKAYESGKAYDRDRPAFFSGATNEKYLLIESAPTATPLVRNVDSAAVAIGNGLYLDTLVKFTVSTETMGTSDENAKLAIWAQTSDEPQAETNFVVQAGYYTGAKHVVSTNYTMTASANFDFTAWHRLTVKAIEDIGDGIVGFVVFVDGERLTRADPAVIGDEGFVPDLNTVAGNFANAVLPSKADYRLLDAQKLTAVSFSGNGEIDDVSFTDVAPTFAADATVYTVTWGTGITGVSYNSTAIVKDAKNEIPAGASFDLVVTLDSGYALGETKASGCTVTANGNTFTVSGATPGASIEFTAFQPAASVVVGNTTTYYASFADAFDDAAQTAGGKITLSTGATLTKALRLQSNTEVIVDLNGQTITGADNRAVFSIEAGTLIITNSSALATGAVNAGAGANGKVLAIGGGLTKVYGGKFTGAFIFDAGGEVQDALEIYGGKFDAASWTGDDLDFELSAVAKAAVSDKPTDGYYTVGGAVEDKVIAVPEAVTGLVYDGTEKTGVEAGTGYTLTGNTGTNAGEYTATATLADGYVWADESKEAKSITWTIAKKTVTATITLAPAEATYDAEKNTVDDYTDATVTFGDDTLANTDYTVTGLDTAVAEAGEFTITVAPAASGSNYTFDTVTAKLTVKAAVPPEPEIEPVDPANGGTAEFKNADAAIAAADAINEDKAKYIAAPEGIANTYYDNVEAKADGNKVSVVFTDDGKTAAQNSADTEVDELDKVLSAAAAGATEASITGAVPGFFYSVVYGTSLTGESAFATEGDRAQADKDGNVKIPVPTAGEGAGFYKVKVSPTK